MKLSGGHRELLLLGRRGLSRSMRAAYAQGVGEETETIKAKVFRTS